MSVLLWNRQTSSPAITHRVASPLMFYVWTSWKFLLVHTVWRHRLYMMGNFLATPTGNHIAVVLNVSL